MIVKTGMWMGVTIVGSHGRTIYEQNVFVKQTEIVKNIVAETLDGVSFEFKPPFSIHSQQTLILGPAFAEEIP